MKQPRINFSLIICEHLIVLISVLVTVCAVNNELKNNEMNTRLPIQWMPGIFPGVEGSGLVKLTTHEVKDELSCNSSPHIRLRGVYSDTVTFRGLLFNHLCHYVNNLKIKICRTIILPVVLYGCET